MKLLDGKATSAQMKQEMAEEVARIKAAGGKVPHLVGGTRRRERNLRGKQSKDLRRDWLQIYVDSL